MAEVRSPEWWLRTIHQQILDRRPSAEKLWRYYDGQHPLAFASRKFIEAFGGLFEAFADNWCDLIVDALGERCNIDGFRFGPNDAADNEAQRIWQANQLDADSELAHTEAFVTGASVITTWFGDDERTPNITISPSTDAAVVNDPRDRRKRAAGLRLWRDEWGFDHAELFLPDAVWMFRSTASVGTAVDPKSMTWEPEDLSWAVPDGIGSRGPNPIGRVPMVALVNRPRLRANPTIGLAAQSEITRVIPVQDAVNLLIADMLVAAERAALPQRYMLGIEIPKDEQGKDVNPFTPDKLVWLAEHDPVSTLPPTVGQFQAADLRNYVAAVEMLIQHIASQTRVPPHYFYLGGTFPSGESIKSAEAGLVAKALRRQRHFGEVWEEVMRLAFAVLNDQRANEVRAETIWADPEYRTEGEHVDALVKLKTLGVPERQLQEDAGYTPQQIARFDSMPADRGATVTVDGPAPDDPDAAVRAKADALGVLIRAGVEPVAAARAVGLAGVTFTGAVPTSLRLPEADAQDLEPIGGAPV